MFRFGRKVHRSVAEASSVEVAEVDGVRSLYLGSDTVQSSMRLKAPYDLELAYSRGMMMFLLFSGNVKDVLMMGLGGGSIAKFIYHYLPELHTRVLEINPDVIRVARSHFYLPEDDERLQVIEGDGAAYIMSHPETADVLLLDAFDGSGVLSELYSQTFFDACAEALKSDGLLAINLWGSDKNFDVYLQRIEQSFNGHVLILRTGRPGNIVVFGFRKPPADLRWTTLRERARLLGEKYRIEFLEFVERLRDNNPNTANRLIL